MSSSTDGSLMVVNVDDKLELYERLDTDVL